VQVSETQELILKIVEGHSSDGRGPATRYEKEVLLESFGRILGWNQQEIERLKARLQQSQEQNPSL
jgi:hypothetical protein